MGSDSRGVPARFVAAAYGTLVVVAVAYAAVRSDPLGALVMGVLMAAAAAVVVVPHWLVSRLRGGRYG